MYLVYVFKVYCDGIRKGGMVSIMCFNVLGFSDDDIDVLVIYFVV